MDVSIIIVSYNTSKLTRQAIRSVIGRTHRIDYELIVVDNASPDGSAEDIAREFPHLRLIALDKNIGFGQANNEGIKYASGRYVFLLNPDTILLNNAVKILSDYLDRNPGCGICGGNLYDADRRPVHSFMRVLPGVKEMINTLLLNIPFTVLFGKNLIFNHGRRPLKVGYITGADMMIRSCVLKEAGLFAPDFFVYYEETELTHRIKKLGYDVVNVPSAKIIHFGGSSFPDRARREQMFRDGLNIYARKVYGSYGGALFLRLSYAMAKAGKIKSLLFGRNIVIL